MAVKKLEIIPTIVEGAKLGIKNFVSLLLTIILYVLTVWIPWLNVGTTIGLYRVIIDMTKGKVINPTSIFSKKNYHNLGNFFLLMGLQSIGVTAACVFMFIPGIVMGIAWGFAIYFFLDKKVSPLKSLQLSYDSTYGNKWRIFAVGFLMSLAICIVCGLLGAIPKAGVVLAVLAAIVCSAICVAIDGVMYNFFSKKADTILEEKRNRHGRCCQGEEPVVDVVEEIDEVITEA